MIYEKYKAKIEKLAKVFKWIKKFRVLIIAVLVFGATLATTLLATRGIIINEGKSPEKIQYGQTFAYDVNAFMSDTDYEFYNEELGKWTTDFPTSVGVYKVRACANTSFGGKRYGKVRTFTIEPKSATVNITSKSVVYGNDPKIEADLVKGDEIRSLVFQYEGMTGNIGDVITATPIVGTIEVYNEEGVNVSGFYAFTAPSATLTFTARPITVSTGSDTKTYDGTALTKESAEVSQNTLAKGDVLIAEEFASTLNGGTSVKNTAKFRVENENKEDVSNYYKITPDWGTLSVSKREITILSSSATKEYDGLALTAESTESIVGTTADGEELVIEYQGSQTKAGTSKNLYSVKVEKTGADGDFKENYQITENYGTLTVSKRKIRFLSASAEKAYDGTALYCHDYTVEEDEQNGYKGLATGDSVEVSYTGSITRAIVKDGQIFGVQNTYSVYIYNADGSAMDNYERTLDCGTLKILTVGLGFTTLSGSRVYNGTPYSLDGYEITQGELFAGDKIVLTGLASIQTAGSVENTAQSYKIVSADGKDATDSYTLLEQDITWGTLTVIPRQVYLISESAEKIYDGTPLTSNKANFSDYLNYEIEGNRLKEGHSVSTTFTGTQTDVGVSPNTYENAEAIFLFNGENVSTSFEICGFMAGNLTVSHRKIKVKTAESTWYYNGVWHFDGDGYETVAYTNAKALPAQGEYYSLLEGLNHELRRIEGTQNEVLNVPVQGEIYNNFTQYEVVLNGDNAVNANYIIEYEHGELKILPRAITVESGGDIKIYDATPITVESCKLAEGSPFTLVEGHYLSGYNYYSALVNVGKAENTFEVVVKTDDWATVGYDDDALLRNYTISKKFGSLEVVHRRIMLKMQDRVWDYDGQEHYDDHVYGNADLVIDNSQITDPLTAYCYLVDYHTIGFDINKLSLLKTIIDHGTIENNLFDCLAIFDENGVDVTSNYSRSVFDGKGSLTVNKLDIYVQTHTHTDFTYDGTFQRDECSYGNGDLLFPTPDFDQIPDTDFLEVDTYTEVKYVGDRKPNVLTFKVFANRNGKRTETTQNYTIYTGEYEGTGFDYGVLEVQHRPLAIRSYSAEEIYNGEVLKAEGYDHYPELANGQKLELTYTEKPWEVGTYENKFTYKIVDETGSEYEEIGGVKFYYKDNYQVYTIFGTLTIFKREITVRASSMTGVYNGTEYLLLAGSYTLPVGTLADGEVLSVETSGVRETNVRLGGYVHEIVQGSAQVKKQTLDGIVNTTDNYEISYEDGLLLIEQRALYLTVHEHSKVYDGKALSCKTECTYSDKDLFIGEINGKTYYDLVPQHTFTVLPNTYAWITAVGSIPNYVTVQVLDENGVPTGDNYTVQYAEGKNLTVSYRTIRVKTHTHDGGVYDAQEHSCENGCEYSSNDLILLENVYYPLADGHSLVVGAYEGITNVVDSGMNNEVRFMICDEFGDYANAESGVYSDNYIIELEKGTLSLQKRAIYVTTRSENWVYDGEEHYQKSVIDFLLEGASYSDIVKQATIYNGTDLTVGEIDGKTYYTLAELNHIILIRNRNERSTVKEVAKDGEEPVQNILEFQVAKLGANRELDVDVGDNYEITVNEEYGILSISPRDLSILSKSAEKIYDGQPLTMKEIEYMDGTEIAPKQIPVITYTGSQTEAYDPENEKQNFAQSKNTYTLDGILDKNGELVDMRNYNILATEYGTLTVYKREILIRADSLTNVYNGEEYVIAPNSYKAIPVSDKLETAMADGHTLTVLTTGAHAIDAGKYANKIISWEISAEALPEVEKNYIVSTETGYLLINKRTVGVIMHGDDAKHTKIYDGNPISCSLLGCVYTQDDLYIDDVDYYGLVKDHSLYLYENPAITDAGSCLNEVGIKVIGDGAEGNYEVVFVEYRELLIKPRPLLVTLHSHTKTYDGEKLSCADLGCVYTQEKDLTVDNVNYYGLVAGHRLVYDDCAVVTYVADNQKNRVALYVDGNEGNYDISFVENVGELTITPRNIWVKTTHTLTFPYDGRDHYDGDGAVVSKYGNSDLYLRTENGILYEEIVSGDVLSTVANGCQKIANVWESGIQNTVQFKVANARNKDITSSYVVRCENYGTLSVAKRAIRIQAKTEKYEYDKTAREISNENKSENFVYVKNAKGRKERIVTGQELQVEVSGAFVDGLKVEKVTNYLYPETIKIVFKKTGSETKEDFNGHKVIENYEIENLADWFNEADNHGYLEIYARKITIKTGSVEEIYDGKTYYDPMVYSKTTEGCISGSGILDGQEISLNEGSRKSITDVGEIKNRLTASDFTIIDEVYGDVTQYYDIKFEVGTLKIIPRPLSITTHTHHFGVYDGEEHSCETEDAECGGVYTLTEEDGLLTGHTVEINFATAILNAGEKTNEVRFLIKDANGEDVTRNYDYLSYIEYGTLYLDIRVLEVKTNGAEKVYDGTDLYFENDDPNGYAIVSGRTAENQYLHIYFTGRQRNAFMEDDLTANGVSKNTFTWAVTDKMGLSDYSENYDIQTVSLGDLVVTKRPVTIRSDDESKAYDGIELRGDSLTCEGLADGEWVDPQYISTQTDVGSCDNEFTYEILWDWYDGVSTYNYVRTVLFGKLEVYKREVHIQAKSLVVPYKAEEYQIYANEWEYTQDSPYAFALDHENYLTLKTSGARGTEIAVYPNKVLSMPAFGNSGISLDNYDIRYFDGALEIIKRKILVVEHSYDTHDHLEKYYDGEEISCQNCVYGSQDLWVDDVDYFDLLPKHSLELIQYTSLIKANKVLNEIVVSVVGENAEDKYEIEYAKSGYILVKKRPIKLVTNDYENVYDGTGQKDTYVYTNADADEFAGTLSLNGNISFMPIVDGQTLSVSYREEIRDVRDSGKENVVEFRIKDKDNTDVTANYDYLNYIEYGTMTLHKRKIKVQLHDCEWIYDGKEHYEGDGLEISPSEYSEWDLIAEDGYYTTLGEGDSLVIDYEKPYSTIVADALLKRTENDLKLKVVSWNDVLDLGNVEETPDRGNYEIEYVKGVMQISKSEIIIMPCTTSKAFDGKPLETEAGEYSLNGDLIEGHKIVINSPAYSLGAFEVEREQINVFTEAEKASLQILDENGQDVSMYYDYTFGEGSLYISKCRVKITPQSKEKYYDGYDLTTEAGKYSVVLLDEDNYFNRIPSIYTIEISSGIFTLDAEILETETAIEFSDEEKASLIVKDLNGNIVENYTDYMDIIFDEGTLLIKKIIVKLESHSDEKDYDGEPLENKNWKKRDLSAPIPDGHEIHYEIVGTITDPGKEKNTIEYWVKDENGTIVTGKYYIFETVEGTLTVNVRNSNSALYIKPEDIVMHAEEELIGSAYRDFSLTKTKYKSGDLYGIIDVEETSTLASMIKHWNYSYEATIQTIGSVRTITSFTLYNEKGEDVTILYQIYKQTGTYKVVDLNEEFIFIDVAEISKVYDGNTLSIASGSFEVRCMFVNDTRIRIRFKSRTLEAKAGRVSSEELLKSVEIINDNGDVVTARYKNIIRFSEVRPIIYKVAVRAELTADNEIIQTDGRLLAGHKLGLNEKKQWAVLSGTKDVTDNYLLFVKE